MNLNFDQQNAKLVFRSEYQSDSKTDLEDNSYSEDELDSDDDFYY